MAVASSSLSRQRVRLSLTAIRSKPTPSSGIATTIAGSRHRIPRHYSKPSRAFEVTGLRLTYTSTPGTKRWVSACRRIIRSKTRTPQSTVSVPYPTEDRSSHEPCVRPSTLSTNIRITHPNVHPLLLNEYVFISNTPFLIHLPQRTRIHLQYLVGFTPATRCALSTSRSAFDSRRFDVCRLKVACRPWIRPVPETRSRISSRISCRRSLNRSFARAARL